MKGQIMKDEHEATTRRLIHALPMSDVIIWLNIPRTEEGHSLARHKAKQIYLFSIGVNSYLNSFAQIHEMKESEDERKALTNSL